MNDLLLFALLFVATGAGWYLGRRSAGLMSGARAEHYPSQYYRGLNYLLDGRPEGAVDAFVNALEVNTDTLETHIALGNLLRKRGEVDRAIRIHQNLLARPSLPRTQVHQAHLELARDYISAGLLDRAERLLLDLVEESSEQRRASRRHLLEIYQSEREWSRAIEVAQKLLPRKSLLGAPQAQAGVATGQSVVVVLAHLYCELACERREAGDLAAAARLLQQALDQDKRCVRASIMLGEVELAAGKPTHAVKALKRVRQQDPEYIPDTIASLRQCYAELGDTDALQRYLRECLEANPSAPLVLAVAEDLQVSHGRAAATEFLSEQLSRQPSLRGLAYLINLQRDDTEGKVSDNLGLLQVLVEGLIAERPSYRCGHCGFAGRQLHWYCPGCKHWGTVKAIRAARLD